MRAIEVQRLVGREALVEASGDDEFVRCSVPPAGDLVGWSAGRGVAWHGRSRRHRGGGGWLTVVADEVDGPALVGTALAEVGAELHGMTVTVATLDGLSEGQRLDRPNRWEWMWTAAAPPRQPGDDRVTWATPADDRAIAALLDGHSPRHSARPGDHDVRGWCVVHDPDGSLVACAAVTEHVPGVPHLASIVTRSDQRGRGLGRTVTAWLTRRLLADGGRVVTLGMYSDNDVARRLYLDLGYTIAHRFASGFLPGRDPGTGTDPVHEVD